MKFCLNCRYLDRFLCEAPQAEEYRDPVHGALPTADMMRSEWEDLTPTLQRVNTETCGRAGAWFEAREEE